MHLPSPCHLLCCASSVSLLLTTCFSLGRCRCGGGGCRLTNTFHRWVSTSQNTRRVVFSGIQPTGTPHLGNYAGAIQQWARLQSESLDTMLLFSVVDLHAITVPQPPGVLVKQRRETLAALLACGIRPDRCSIFYQSSVRIKTCPPLTQARYELTHPPCRSQHIRN